MRSEVEPGELPDTGSDEARRLVQRILQSTPQGQTCPAGVAELRSGDTAGTLVARADRAMYAARHGGKE